MSEDQPKLLRSIRYHDEPVVALAFSPDGEPLVTGGRNRGVIAFWDVKTPSDTPRTILPAERNCGVWALAFSPDGATLAERRRSRRTAMSPHLVMFGFGTCGDGPM